MTDPLTIGTWIILATQVVALVGSVVSIVLALRNKHAINEVHISLNSRLTQLLEMNKDIGRSEGRAETQQAQSASKLPSGP